MNLTENILEIKKQRLEILHQTGQQLLDVKEEKEVFEIMSKAINKVLPGVFYVITKLQDDDLNFRVVETYGLNNYFDTIEKIIGKDFRKVDFPFNNLTEIQLKSFESKKLIYFENGIYELTNGVINKTICRAIEKIFNLEIICSIAFNIEKKYFGGINLFITKYNVKSGLFDEEAAMIIETITYQGSAVIQRLRDSSELRKKEKELKIGQKKFNQLINQLNDVVWTANGEGTNVIDLNNSFQEFYGYNAEYFNKNPNSWKNIVHPEDREIVAKSEFELSEKGHTDFEYRIVRSDGSIIWLHDRKSIVFDNDGNPIQMGGLASDITYRKQIEEQLLIKDYALEASNTAVGLTDFNGILFFVNNAFVKLWGYNNKDEIIGKHISDFANSEDKLKEIIRTIENGKTFKGEGIIKNSDNAPVNVLISADLVYSNQGKPICMMGLITDITNIKKTEKQLKELSTTKDKLFSIIAHDLKSPFNAILGFSQLLASDFNNLSDEKRLHFINIINSSIESAYKLLENLLDWARIQREQIVLNKEVLNVKELISKSIDVYKLTTFNKGVHITINVPKNLFVFADKYTLKSAIYNIFNNAVKFSHRGDTIELAAKRVNDFIEISIKDTGIGMSSATINKLFDISKTGSTLGTNNENGTGLGLIICKEFIIKNEGELIFESELGKGSIFKIILPIAFE